MHRTQYKIVLAQHQKIVTKEAGEKEINTYDPCFQHLKLQIGSSFWTIEKDFEAIYQNFNLLSYFSNSCQISIVDRIYGTKQQNFLSYDHFKIGSQDNSLYMIQKTKDKLDVNLLPKLNKSLRLQYIVAKKINEEDNFDIQRLQNLSTIVVQISTEIHQVEDNQIYLIQVVKDGQKFKKVLSQKRQLIVIKIINKDQWISNKFDEKMFGTQNHRISPIRKSGLFQTQYFYKEPNSKRNKFFDEQHYSLALQGGGCKGVLYIGAYKALLSSNNKAKITSLIGSSAGGIIGLAICCQLDPQQIVQVCQEKLSKITTDQKYKTIGEDPDRIMEKTFKDIFDLLAQLNIFDSDIIKILKNFISDKRVQSLLLQLIGVAMNPEVQRLFIDQSQPGKLNLVGLLKASLMTGNKIAQIGADCITFFLKKQLREQNPTFLAKYPNVKEQQLYKIAENITMSQLYELTGVQFTCTSVDTNDKILRFFNQKTTPHLPVCKAIQMTGSFPIAFEAQKWKKQWGKYYIHYQNFRREVDITSHSFTDGGTLSNFPVKYLDNEDMRPMYFSHAKTSNTIMYGVGLIVDIDEDPTKKKKINDILARLLALFKDQVSIVKSMWSWVVSQFKTPAKKTIPLTPNTFSRLTSIPLISFGLDLLTTYCKTKDNLSQQCFSHQCFQTYFNQSMVKYIEDKPDNNYYVQKNIQIVQQIEDIFRKMPNNQPQEVFKSFCSKLQVLSSDQNTHIFNEQRLCLVTQIIFSNFHTLIYLLTQNVQPEIVQQIFQRLSIIANEKLHLKTTAKDIIPQLNKIKFTILTQNIFVLSDIQYDKAILNKVCQVLQTFSKQLLDENINKIHSQLLKEALYQASKIQKKYVQKLINEFKMYINIQNINNQVENQIIYLLEKLSKNTLTMTLKNMKKIYDIIISSQIPKLFIEYDSSIKKDSIASYVLHRINRSRAIKQKSSVKFDGIHIVLECVQLSQSYFHYYYSSVRQALFLYNSGMQEKGNNQSYLNLKTITATGYHCLGIFLHASDLPQHRIKQQIWKIPSLIKIDKQSLQKKYKNADWLKLTPILLKQVQKLAIDRKRDIFKAIQQNIMQSRKQKAKQFDKLKQKIQDSMEGIQASNDQLIQAIETSLNYVVNLLMEIQTSKKRTYQTDVAKIIENLILNTSPQKREQRMAKYTKGLQSMIQFFAGKYQDILHYITYESPLVIDKIIKMLKPSERYLAWKGIILSEIISGNQIRSFVQRILIQLNLKPTTTLKQFYDYSQKKIQLNFSVIEESVVSIFNQKTRPNMPVWAAILAASSTPQFFAPVVDRPQWKYNLEKDYKARMVRAYFQNPVRPYQHLSSSEQLTRMPLDLLQNHEFQKRITDYQNEVFLVFNFSDFKIPNIGRQMVKNLVITQLTIGQLLTNFVSFTSVIVGSITGSQIQSQQKNNVQGLKLITQLPALQSKTNMLGLYVNSHDNLIKQLYKRQLAQMPVRLDTLDFHLMTFKQKNGKERLSNLCEDAIMQAQYILKQKLENKYFHKIAAYRKGIFMQNKQQQDIIGAAMFKKDENYEQRLLYFRVQSQPFTQQNRKSLRKKYLSSPQQALNNLQANNVINIRFLSMLNPSQAIYEKHYIYYKKTSNNNVPYVKLNTESLLLERKSGEKLYIKIQFCSGDQSFVKCRYFILDFVKLFELSFDTRKKTLQTDEKQYQKQFGFVYKIQFNTFYSQYNDTVQLIPMDGYKEDYMNKDNGNLTPPSIKITSDIKDTAYESVICQKCVYPFRLERRKRGVQVMNQNNTDEETYLVCDNCKNNRHLLRNRFKIQYDSNENTLRCALQHTICRKNKCIQNNFSFIKCDFCGRGTMNYHWQDSKCNVKICDSCRNQKMVF